MKAWRVLIFVGCAVGTFALVWQARTIAKLRAENAEIRKDLSLTLDHALADTDPSSAAHDKLELIKLRHEVRELKEGIVESHTRERNANLRTVARLFLPASGQSGPYKIRPEWKGQESRATNLYAKAIKGLSATNDYVRFLNMNGACKMSFAVGRTEDARRLANDMLAIDENRSRGVPENRNGDVVHDGHVVLGRIALEDGRLDEAKRHLLIAGTTRGSPVLCSFGPNMSLARDLLDKGEQQTVIEYFELCRKFWNNMGKLDEWTRDINAGRIPEFGASLIY